MVTKYYRYIPSKSKYHKNKMVLEPDIHIYIWHNLVESVICVFLFFTIITTVFSNYNYDTIICIFTGRQMTVDYQVSIWVSVVELEARNKAHITLLCKQSSGHVFVYILNFENKIPCFDLKWMWQMLWTVYFVQNGLAERKLCLKNIFYWYNENKNMAKVLFT